MSYHQLHTVKPLCCLTVSEQVANYKNNVFVFVLLLNEEKKPFYYSLYVCSGEGEQ